jgi:hypothetical protein
MARSPEKPPINDASLRSATPEEKEIARRWYDDTSHAGRTSAEFKVLREELRKTTVLDFVKYRGDRDYENLIDENPHVQEFRADTTKYDLLRIRERRKEIGLSDEQFNRLLSIFDEDIQKNVHTFIAQSGAVKTLYKRFSPAKLKEHSDEVTAEMKREIELQEQNIPHERVKLSPFPRKKAE